MVLYNSASRQKEEFVPYEPGKVSMYTCGPTVYHFAHIGNLRSYLMEDVLEKYLRYAGYDVTRVMNITDVGHLASDADTGEDKMLKGAKREHKTVLEIIERIQTHYEKSPTLGGGVFQFTDPFKWVLQDEPSWPYFYGACNLSFNLYAQRTEGSIYT